MSRHEHPIAISALTRDGLHALLALVGERLEQLLVPVELTLPWNAQDLLPEVHTRGRVLSENFVENGVALAARVPEDVANRLRRAAGIEAPKTEDW